MSSPQRIVSYRGLFKRFCILELQSEYICALMTFIVNNYEISLSNIEVHEVNTRHRHYPRSVPESCALWRN
jgi:hypothetical protein